MQVRFQNSPKETATMSTKETRDNFLIQNLMDEKIKLVLFRSEKLPKFSLGVMLKPVLRIYLNIMLYISGTGSSL